jgi:hypothetical protein
VLNRRGSWRLRRLFEWRWGILMSSSKTSAFADIFNTQAGVAAQVVRKLDLDPPEVRQLVIDAERLLQGFLR